MESRESSKTKTAKSETGTTETSSTKEVVRFKSCFKKPGGSKPGDRTATNRAYTFFREEDMEICENRVKEWKEGYRPGIIPQHMRNRRRTQTLNPHFLTFPKSKRTLKRKLYVRLGIIELSLQNGLGARYRLIPAPKKSFDFPMKCVSRVIYGCGCSCCVIKLRNEACLHVVKQWNTYKWEVKFSYSFHIEYFRRYDPLDEDERIHVRAQYLYKIAVLERMYECTRLEIGVACQLHDTNFYCIEAVDHESFKVYPSETTFDRSVYFFAKEIPYAGKMLDRHIDLYENYYLIWLCPVIDCGNNLIMNKCLLRITYCNADIGYFHLFEEDPRDPIPEFNISNNFRRRRNHIVRYNHFVYGLHYYQKPRPCRIWKCLMQAFGIWQEPEADSRILKYNKLMVNRYHQMEKEFMRISEIADPSFPHDAKQIKGCGQTLEEYLSHLKNRTEKEFKLRYKGNKIQQKFKRKWWRNRARLVKISQKFYSVPPVEPKQKPEGPPKHIPHQHTRHRKHRISRHRITQSDSKSGNQSSSRDVSEKGETY